MTTSTAAPASDKQIAFIRNLLKQVGADTERTERIESNVLPVLSKREASNLIEDLLDEKRSMPVVAPESSAPAVPDGAYAVTMDDTLKFYKVRNVTSGKWAGWTFVDHQVSEYHYPVKGSAKDAVLEAIAKVGPEQASRTYGRELGVCGVCGTTLTNEDSRAAGIGPVCARKFG